MEASVHCRKATFKMTGAGVQIEGCRAECGAYLSTYGRTETSENANAAHRSDKASPLVTTIPVRVRFVTCTCEMADVHMLAAIRSAVAAPIESAAANRNVSVDLSSPLSAR
jgi:hypothetical protein